MNAPVTAIQLAPATLKILKLDQLTPSATHVQAMRRKRFGEDKLQELADSIKKVGILQAIVVRPAETAGQFEIIAGERRWLAARLAGLTELPANVTNLPDAMLLEVQLVENLQREGLHEMEEAEGYEELRKLRGITPEVVATLVGKSRSYVYGRIKLLALCPEARKAFYAGEIDSSKALLVARIGHHDTQRKALKDITEEDHRGETMSFRNAHRHVVENYMLKLKVAPFDPAAADLVPKAGACEACPKRTGNQVDLFNDVKDPNVCTDPKCFDDKRQAHYAVKVKALEAKGKKVIYGAAAKNIFREWDSHNQWSSMTVTGGYIPMDKQDYIAGRYQTPAQLLGKAYEPVVIQHPASGKLIDFAAPADIAKAAKEKEAARAKKAKSTPRSSVKQAQGQDATELLTPRLIELVHAKGSALLSIDGLKVILLVLFDSMSNVTSNYDEAAFEKLWGWPKDTLNWGSRKKFIQRLDTMNGSQLGQLAVEMASATQYCDGGNDGDAFLKVLQLDPAAELKKIEAELKAAAEAKAASKGAKK